MCVNKVIWSRCVYLTMCFVKKKKKEFYHNENLILFLFCYVPVQPVVCKEVLNLDT